MQSKLLENKFTLETEIKFEVYYSKINKTYSLYVIDVSDVRNSQLHLSYKEYKNIMAYISSHPEFLQKEIKGLELDKCESEKLYTGIFLLEITTWICKDTEDLTCKGYKTLSCQSCEIAKYEVEESK
jgi:hypothetical protein